MVSVLEKMGVSIQTRKNNCGSLNAFRIKLWALKLLTGGHNAHPCVVKVQVDRIRGCLNVRKKCQGTQNFDLREMSNAGKIKIQSLKFKVQENSIRFQSRISNEKHKHTIQICQNMHVCVHLKRRQSSCFSITKVTAQLSI